MGWVDHEESMANNWEGCTVQCGQSLKCVIDSPVLALLPSANPKNKPGNLRQVFILHSLAATKLLRRS